MSASPTDKLTSTPALLEVLAGRPPQDFVGPDGKLTAEASKLRDVLVGLSPQRAHQSHNDFHYPPLRGLDGFELDD